MYLVTAKVASHKKAFVLCTTATDAVVSRKHMYAEFILDAWRWEFGCKKAFSDNECLGKS